MYILFSFINNWNKIKEIRVFNKFYDSITLQSQCDPDKLEYKDESFETVHIMFQYVPIFYCGIGGLMMAFLIGFVVSCEQIIIVSSIGMELSLLVSWVDILILWFLQYYSLTCNQ